MKTKFAASALILATGLIAGTSFAAISPNADAQVIDYAAMASTTTREAVKANYLAAKNAGALPQNSDAQVTDFSAIPSTTTREAVRNEFLIAKKNGTLPMQSATAAVAFMSGRSV